MGLDGEGGRTYYFGDHVFGGFAVEDFNYDSDLQLRLSKELDTPLCDLLRRIMPRALSLILVPAQAHRSYMTRAPPIRRCFAPYFTRNNKSLLFTECPDNRRSFLHLVGSLADAYGRVNAGAGIPARSCFFVNGVDGEERVAVAEDSADGPLKRVGGFFAKIRRDKVHSLPSQALLCFHLILAEIATEDLSYASMCFRRAVDG
jgi:hypothetical protein